MEPIMHTDAPFDYAQGRPFDYAQGRPFDTARCLNNDRSRAVVGRMRDVWGSASAVSRCDCKRTHRTQRT